MQESFDRFLDSEKLRLKDLLDPLSQLFACLSHMWVSLAVVAVVFTALVCYHILHGGKSFRRQVRSPRVLATCALMIAVNIILGYFSIRLSAYLRIGFGFVTQPIIAMLFGPLTACMTAILQDTISMVLTPTGAYLPAYTLSVGISGMLYGMVLYQKKVTFWRVFCAKLLVILIGNILLNSIALAPTAGSGFIGVLPARILKNLLLLPVQSVVCYILLKFIERRGIAKKL